MRTLGHRLSGLPKVIPLQLHGNLVSLLPKSDNWPLSQRVPRAPGAFLPSLFCPSIHPCGRRVFSCDFQCKSLDEAFDSAKVQTQWP